MTKGRSYLGFARTGARALVGLGLALAAAPGCIEASQEPVAYDAVVVSRGAGATRQGEWSVTLTRADVALGPFYFCAASSGSSTLCESAVAELTTTTVVDAMSTLPSPLGKVRGFSGVIASASYDYGISWFETQREPTPGLSLTSSAPGRRSLGGHSLRLEAVARKGAQVVQIVADVDVVPQFQGQNAISTTPASATVGSSATRLEVVVDPAAWLRQLDFDAIGASGKSPFAITPGTAEHNAILVGLKNLSPPELRWVALVTP